MMKSHHGYSYLVHFWFSLLIIATTFTKLRFFGAFGVHDILFVLTLLALITFKQNKILFFYTIFFIFISLMTLIINHLLSNPIADSFVHDMLALLLNGLFLSVIINNDKISISKLLYSLYVLTTIYLICIYILGVLFELDYFWWQFNIDYARLSGLASNPNQTSFVVFLLSGLSLYYVINSTSISKKSFHIFILLFSILISLHVDSDALYIGIIAFLLFTIFLYLPAYFKVFTIILTTTVMIYIFLNIEVLESYTSTFQAQERLSRWLSFEGLFPQVLVIGFGLGAHGPSFADTYAYVIGSPLQNTEFHNIFLDLFSQFGILFSFFIISIYIYNLMRMYNKKLYLFIALAIGLFAMSFFHMYLRHPIFWLIALMPFIYQYKENNKCVG